MVRVVECGAIWRKSGSKGITVVIPLANANISIDSRERVSYVIRRV
mgnify:CR=1 FL=1